MRLHSCLLLIDDVYDWFALCLFLPVFMVGMDLAKNGSIEQLVCRISDVVRGHRAFTRRLGLDRLAEIRAWAHVVDPHLVLFRLLLGVLTFVRLIVVLGLAGNNFILFIDSRTLIAFSAPFVADITPAIVFGVTTSCCVC